MFGVQKLTASLGCMSKSRVLFHFFYYLIINWKAIRSAWNIIKNLCYTGDTLVCHCVLIFWLGVQKIRAAASYLVQTVKKVQKSPLAVFVLPVKHKWRINTHTYFERNVCKPPGDMGWTRGALIGPECKHPNRNKVQWKAWAVRNQFFLSSFLMCEVAWYCSYNTINASWETCHTEILTVVYAVINKAKKMVSSVVLSLQEKEGVEAVSVGAILSDYQRIRVENV